MKPRRPSIPILTGMRTVAVFEAAKGALVLLAGFGVLSLIHHDVQAAADRFVRLSHLNPAGKYPRIFLDAVTRLDDARLWWLAALALGYAVGRAIEAYGLWRGRRWAEWFALAAGASYLPIEAYELRYGLTWFKAGIIATNLVVVAYMAYALRQPAANRV